MKSQIDRFQIGDQVSVTRCDGTPRQAVIASFEFHRYDDFLALNLGYEGYYTYVVLIDQTKWANVHEREVS